MKAITLWQPWASLMALGYKKVETRSWATRHRGLTAIHSALRKPGFLGHSCDNPDFCKLLTDLKIEPVEFPLGCVLCTATLVAIAPTGDVYDDLSEQERIFGNYEEGRYAWFFEDIQSLKTPIPVKGNRLLWNLDDRILERVQ